MFYRFQDEHSPSHTHSFLERPNVVAATYSLSPTLHKYRYRRTRQCSVLARLFRVTPKYERIQSLPRARKIGEYPKASMAENALSFTREVVVGSEHLEIQQCYIGDVGCVVWDAALVR